MAAPLSLLQFRLCVSLPDPSWFNSFTFIGCDDHRWSLVRADLQVIAALSSSLLDVHEGKKYKSLSTLCDGEHLLCLVKYLQQRGGRGGGWWGAVGGSDLFWSANNLSEDKVADPPMLGSLLLEGI